LDVRFGGNLDRSKAKQTGCILCLDTCPVGITSNASHPQGSFDGKLVEFKGNKDVLPADGTGVIVSFKLKNS
jgi:Fe-S-cluster-containing hydrogenase component 2